MMFNRKAIIKLKAILIIDLLIVAAAAGTYLYLTNAGIITQGPGPAKFALTDLAIEPLEAEAGEPVAISCNLTNIGGTQGNYTAILLINNSTKDAQNITLLPSESVLLAFDDTESVEGNYIAQIGDLTGSFLIKPAPPVTSSIILSKLLATPYEGWVDEPINITIKATNPSSSTDSLGVKLTITQKETGLTYTETKPVELEAGKTTTVEFTYNASSEGTYNVKVNNQFSAFIIVPTGMHNLLVLSTPTKSGVDLKIDGVDFKTPKTELLTVGVPHVVVFPALDPTGKYSFVQWEDGSRNPTRQIVITQRTTIMGTFSGGASCPSMFLWNGTEWTYVTEVSNHGWLGYIDRKDSSNSAVPFTFYANNPWDYIPFDGDQTALVDGSHLVKLSQKWNEIFYLDQAYMVAVDHPSDVNVYSTMVEQYLDPDYMGQIYTVSKDLLSPISAVNEKGQNVMSQISKIDNIFTPGINGINSPSWDDIQWNKLTLNLGDLSKATQIKLVVNAAVDWGSPDDYVTWLGKFYDPLVPDGTEVTPPPFMEVKTANGSWIRVPMGRQFPIPPETIPRTYVVDLTGLFPTNDYELRINNFWNVTFDYIGIDTSTQSNIVVHMIDPTANLYQAFSTGSISSGNFTKYGDVTELITAEDDEFVIGRQGDEVSLNFSTTNLPSLGQGMQRDYFLFVSCWFKDESGNWGFGFGFDVDPLPFRNMTSFPYTLETERYPSDEAHLAYLRDYNTRVFIPPTEGSIFPMWIVVAAAAATLIVFTNTAIYVRYRKRNQVRTP